MVTEIHIILYILKILKEQYILWLMVVTRKKFFHQLMWYKPLKSSTAIVLFQVGTGSVNSYSELTCPRKAVGLESGPNLHQGVETDMRIP